MRNLKSIKINTFWSFFFALSMLNSILSLNNINNNSNLNFNQLKMKVQLKLQKFTEYFDEYSLIEKINTDSNFLKTDRHKNLKKDDSNQINLYAYYDTIKKSIEYSTKIIKNSEKNLIAFGKLKKKDSKQAGMNYS